jgi:hypothetical protein
VSLEDINIARQKKRMLKMASQDTLLINDEFWDFIINNKFSSIFSYVIKKYREQYNILHNQGEILNIYTQNIMRYIDALNHEEKNNLLYDQFNTENIDILMKLADFVKDLNLLDIKRCLELLKNDNFEIQKIGVRISVYDKSFYYKNDIDDFEELVNFIENNFKERGVRSSKKQLFSTEDKEVWVCECGKTNAMDNYCSSCSKDIYGFSLLETHPKSAIKIISEKIELIRGLLNES